MKLFIGIFPPKEILDELRDALRIFDKQKRNLKNIPVDQMHITLKFIGSLVSEESKGIIVDEFRSMEGRFGSLDIKLRNLHFGFSRDTFPKILFTAIETTPQLKDLVDQIHQVIKELKLRDTIRWKEHQRTDYHITMARLKRTATKSTAKLIQSKAKNTNKDFNIKFKATEMYLVESIISQDNSPVYRKIERISL
jgi:2'-5' RNA ligase